jgi:hypothetical protein
MLSIQLFYALAAERERMIQDHLRVRRLLREAAAAREASAPPAAPAQPEPWRASTPRARATTR